MDKFKKLIFGDGRKGAREDSDQFSKRASQPSRHVSHRKTHVDKEKFADAVVRDYGETLVMLGKE